MSAAVAAATGMSPEAFRLLAAWQKSEAASSWPSAIDCLCVATWRGVELLWPQLEGESFAIIRTANSAVVEDEELGCEEACSLLWRAIKLARGAVHWASPKSGGSA